MSDAEAKKPPEPACRLYALIARDGRTAVVFRRGPSKQVLLLRWWLDDDRIEPGQWLHGRIYERRCDLSLDGELLIYFAASWRPPHGTWTAVSRPPYLTALALWPKGDAWGGGGVFDEPHIIGLNHLSLVPPILPGVPAKWHPLGSEPQPLPSNYSVRRWGDYAGRGEDNPIHHHRMSRDGWRCIAAGNAGPHRNSGYAWLFNEPEIYEHSSPDMRLVLRRYLRAVYEANGPWYVEEFEVCTADGRVLRVLPRCSWADWHHSGDLLFAIGPCIYRLDVKSAHESASEACDGAKLVADLASLRFKPVVSPDWAKTWPVTQA